MYFENLELKYNALFLFSEYLFFIKLLSVWLFTMRATLVANNLDKPSRHLLVQSQE